ncbi:MAG: hypothetical protein LBB23_04015 [Rickettsiales bacterium]|jgi:type IV pilus biogenesis protein PilP|nr:hypothetical protein [Rickettsiales bacterium]
MLNKILAVLAALVVSPALADDIDLGGFDADGSVFLRITALEQDKVLMRLEKERAQLELDLNRIEAEKTKLSGARDSADAASSATAELAAKLDEEKKKFAGEIESLKKQMEAAKSAPSLPTEPVPDAAGAYDISEIYKLLNISGSADNLTALVENIPTGQRRRVQAGRSLDGMKVVAVSADEGVIFQSEDGDEIILGISTISR